MEITQHGFCWLADCLLSSRSIGYVAVTWLFDPPFCQKMEDIDGM